MFEASANLGRAIGIDAAPGDAFITFDTTGGAGNFGVTLGTSLRERKGISLPKRFVNTTSTTAGITFAGLFDSDGITNADVLLADIIFVVQSRPADGAAGEEDGFQFGDRSKLPVRPLAR